MTREDWEVIRLGDITDVIMWQSPKWETYTEDAQYMPFFQWCAEFWEYYPVVKKYCTSPIKIASKWDILMSVRAPVWKLNYADQECCIGRWLCAIRNNHKSELKFIYYILKSKQEEFNHSWNWSIFNAISKIELNNLEISLPPLHEQQRIASILSAYDDLIENNTRRIALLEQMAQTLYRQWFVEYKFPWYQDVKMIESGTEFGMIPQGWEVKKIGEMVENFDNQRRPLSTMVRLNRQWKYPYYGAAKIIDYIDDYIFDWKYLLLAEDWSVITTWWKPVLQYVDEKFWVSNHAHILRWKWISTNFLYIFFSQVDIWPYITWAAQPKISQSNLNRIPILVPFCDILDRFDNNIWSMIEDIFNLQKQNQSLKEQRDILLRKLIG
jgi:type I restriction enzyme S subunit